MSEGGGNPVIGILNGILGGLLGGGGDVNSEITNLQKAVQTTWTNIIDVGSFLAAALQGEIDAMRGIIDDIGKALDWLGHTVLGHLKDLLQEIIKLLHNIHAVIASLVKYLEQLQKQYNQLMGQQMRKWLDLIQRIRKILVPFRLLHIGIAAKLDTYLATIESDIGAKWAHLIAKQNEVIGILNDVLDPRQLLRPGHALGAAGMAIGSIHEAIGAADVRTLFCVDPLQVPQPYVEPWAATSTSVLGDIQNNSGDYAVQGAQRDVMLRQYAQDLGTPSLA
jgi:hypothetical protein